MRFLQALLDLLLPGIHLDENNTHANPAVENTALSTVPSSGGTTNLKSSIDPRGSSAAPVVQHVCNESTLAAVLVCRLTGQRFIDPVIAADGYTYEREALAAWLRQGKGQSPVTGQPLSSGAVRTNFALRELLWAPCT